MDYKEEYLNALERAKMILCNLPEGSSSTRDIETIFPELKETEDEGIRKFLVELVSNDKANNYNGLYEDRGVRFDDVLAYLEKQKEQKTLILDGEIEDRKRDIVAAIRKFYPADYAEYLTSFLKGLSPEDNSEDEYGQEMLGIAYKLMYEHIPENLRTQEFWDSLKFMREYTGKVAIIHSYEKPAEWSDEDKKIIGRLRSVVNECAFRNGALDVNGDYCEGDYGELDAWLKSLCPQPHWKPSEEQMDILDKVYHYLWADRNATADMQDGLGDFIDELKSL